MQRLSRDMRRVLGTWQMQGGKLHVHLGDAALAPLGRILKAFSVRVTCTACGLDVIYPHAWYQWLIRKTLPKLDHIVCISTATAEEVHKRGVPSHHITVIPCGVWPEECVDGNRPVVGLHMVTVGRLIPRKGVAWFLQEVFPSIVRRFPQCTYSIIGDGAERQKIEQIILKNGLQERVNLYTNFDHKKKKDLLHTANLFVMPNVRIAGDMEGFGIVCIEASAAGVPVVAANIEGVRDAVIDGQTGRLFMPEDAYDCERVIVEMMDMPLPSADVRTATHENFSWDVLGPRVISAITDV